MTQQVIKSNHFSDTFMNCIFLWTGFTLSARVTPKREEQWHEFGTCGEATNSSLVIPLKYLGLAVLLRWILTLWCELPGNWFATNQRMRISHILRTSWQICLCGVQTKTNKAPQRIQKRKSFSLFWSFLCFHSVLSVSWCWIEFLLSRDQSVYIHSAAHLIKM